MSERLPVVRVDQTTSAGEDPLGPCSRRKFLILVEAAIGAGAVIACGGTTVDSVSVTQGNQAMLSFAQFPELKSQGGAVIVNTEGSPIAVVRTSSDKAIALSAICTHAGCLLDYTGSDLYCACHGSDFDLTGRVIRGPARRSLRSYDAVLGTDGITVTL